MAGKFEKPNRGSSPENPAAKLDQEGVKALVEKYEVYGLSADTEYFIIPDCPEKGQRARVLRFVKIARTKEEGGREVVTHYTKIEDYLRERLAISLKNREYKGPDPQSLL